MTLSAGTRLGPYEILAPLGAGGMGEVYRAQDPRLSRDVAIKVLPASFSQDADRLKRFEQEARAAGVLNHPNITAVYDFGTQDDAPYIVTELLEGETLRARLLGRVAPGAQGDRLRRPDRQGPGGGAREGHRPPGPEAREPVPDEGRAGQDPRLRPGEAEAGRRGERSDGRGNGLRRHGAGCRPGDDRLHGARAGAREARGQAVRPLLLRDDPLRDALGPARVPRRHGGRHDHGDPDRRSRRTSRRRTRTIHPGLERIVRHCLEKNPEERFESARDVAFDLESLSSVSTQTGAVLGAGRVEAIAAGSAGPSRRGARPRRGSGVRIPVRQEGGLRSAPQLPAAHVPARRDLLRAVRARRADRPVRRGLGREAGRDLLDRARIGPSRACSASRARDVLAISETGEMAVSLDRHNDGPFTRSGTLAGVGVSGGVAPREILKEVAVGGLEPDGKTWPSFGT